MITIVRYEHDDENDDCDRAIYERSSIGGLVIGGLFSRAEACAGASTPPGVLASVHMADRTKYRAMELIWPANGNIQGLERDGIRQRLEVRAGELVACRELLALALVSTSDGALRVCATVHGTERKRRTLYVNAFADCFGDGATRATIEAGQRRITAAGRDTADSKF